MCLVRLVEPNGEGPKGCVIQVSSKVGGSSVG
jgi:hypothetical protein